ncbi:hypothetical protein COLO4_22908 [Corchorus olitorius]|uniref:Uncharacterized protein n=1 Tax=Corchorus olitorius TaxID=93759 RepID=A0A1R3IJ80_9ROSI|nr:hypothetical protein COLO4_22908 [Corchorus olitorius]
MPPKSTATKGKAKVVESPRLGEDGETNYYEAPEEQGDEEDEEDSEGSESAQEMPPLAPGLSQAQNSQPSTVHSSGRKKQKSRRSFGEQVGEAPEIKSTVTNIHAMLEDSSLNEVDKSKAGGLILQDPNKVSYFISLPDEFKRACIDILIARSL